LVHVLVKDVIDSRLQLCELLCHSSDIMMKVMWSDEADFKLSGPINRPSCMYVGWEVTNPHITSETTLNQLGISVGRYFLVWYLRSLHFWRNSNYM